MYGLIASQYGDINALIDVPGEVVKQSIMVYVKDHFGYDKDFLGVVAVVLVGFAAFFAFIYAYCIKTLNFQRR